MNRSTLRALESMALFLGLLILVAQTRAEPAKVPTPSELAGDYAYAGQREKDEAAIKAKVDAATADMSRMVSKRAMPRLESTTQIPQKVMIAHQGSSVTFKMDDHVVTVPEQGGSVPVTTPLGETADASLDVKTATLLQSVAKTGGQKRNAFRFNAAGQLVMDVRITNSKLASPVTFSLVYARVNP
ncbi:MAG: hypothetical protein WBM48_19405 [Polyangiales bacterium]